MSCSAPPTASIPENSNGNSDSFLTAGWRRKGWVVSGMIVGIVIAGAVTTQLPRVYQSSAQISIVKKRPDAATGIDTRGLSADDNTSPPQDVLKSFDIINRAIQSKGLDSLSLNVPEDQDLTETIRNALTITPAKVTSGRSSVFRLHFRCNGAKDSQTVLAALLDSYKEFVDKKHLSVSEDTIEMIMRDKKTLEKEIAEKEASYRLFREKAPLLGRGKDGSELRQETLNSIQAKRSALLLHKVEVEGQLAALEGAIKEGRREEVVLAMLVDFMRKAEGAEPGRERPMSLQDQLFPMLLEERRLVQIHGVKHAEVVELRKRIEAARLLMLLPAAAWKGESDPTENGGNAPVDPVKLHVQLLKQKLQHVQIAEDLLADVFKKEQDEARNVASFEIQNDTFRTRITMNQQLYEALTKRLTEVSLIRNVGGYQIDLLEPPSLGKKVAPSMAISLAVGALLGLGLGFGLACWMESRGTQADIRKISS